jgi:hypothetical protein
LEESLKVPIGLAILFPEGIVDPIRINPPVAKLGLGKQEEDDEYAKKAAQKRKELESEKEVTQEVVKKREDKLTKEKQIKEELVEINKVFFCQLCNKQYSKIMEYETHLSSYDHNHKKVIEFLLSHIEQRFQDMKQMEKMRQGSSLKNKKEKQAQKELQAVMLKAAKYNPTNTLPTPPPIQ